MKGVVSVRTWLVAAIALAATVVFQLAMRATGGDDSALGNVGQNTVISFAVAVMVWALGALSVREPIGRQWAWLMSGSAMFLAGNIVWTYYENGLDMGVPFPGVPDFFYLGMYPLLAIGVFSALLSFRKLFDLKPALLVAAVVCVAATVGLYFAVFQAIIADPASDLLYKVISMGYPVADIWLLLLPGIALAITASRLGGGRIAWPWWCAVGGFVLIAVADVFFNIATWNGTYQSGGLADSGWMLGFCALAVGASLVVDVQKPREQ